MMMNIIIIIFKQYIICIHLFVLNLFYTHFLCTHICILLYISIISCSTVWEPLS